MPAKPSISTHVLDAERGVPARGVRVELYRQGTLVSAQQTNGDGRGGDLVPGVLEAGGVPLVFFFSPGVFFRVVRRVPGAHPRPPLPNPPPLSPPMSTTTPPQPTPPPPT